MSKISDVARKAQVSTSTVSHVLNQTRFVSPDLAERVRQAMAELKYQPDAIARSLRRRRTETLGIIGPDAVNPFVAEVARGISEVTAGLGYTLILGTTEWDLDKEREFLDMLVEKRVDGVFFIALGETAQQLNSLNKDRIPFVIIDRTIANLDADCVLVDDFSSGRQVARHLVERGHRRLACITGLPPIPSVEQRTAGFLSELAALGCPLDSQLLKVGDFTLASGYTMMQSLLNTSAPPTAVFACNDFMALGAMRAAHEAGLRLPRDVALVGFDDINFSAFATPSLTTVEQPKQQMGQLAARLLLARIENAERPVEHHILEAPLVIREST